MVPSAIIHVTVAPCPCFEHEVGSQLDTEPTPLLAIFLLLSRAAVATPEFLDARNSKKCGYYAHLYLQSPRVTWPGVKLGLRLFYDIPPLTTIRLRQ